MNLLQNFHLAVIEYLYHVRRAVHLQTYATRHRNRKLILMINVNLTSYLAPFRSYSIPNLRNCYISLPLYRLNPLTEGFPWDDLREIFSACQWMVPDSEEK